MGRSKTPRVGTRVRFEPTPASFALYDRPPSMGEEGRVTSVETGSGHQSFIPGPGGGLVYVEWDRHGVMGVAPQDLKSVGKASKKSAPSRSWKPGETAYIAHPERVARVKIHARGDGGRNFKPGHRPADPYVVWESSTGTDFGRQDEYVVDASHLYADWTAAAAASAAMRKGRHGNPVGQIPPGSSHWTLRDLEYFVREGRVSVPDANAFFAVWVKGKTEYRVHNGVAEEALNTRKNEQYWRPIYWLAMDEGETRIERVNEGHRHGNPVASKIPKANIAMAKALDTVLLEEGAVLLHTYEPSPTYGLPGRNEYQLQTRYGLLRATTEPNATSPGAAVFMRFESPELARDHVPGVNPHSGKWNQYYFTRSTEEAVEALRRSLGHVLPDRAWSEQAKSARSAHEAWEASLAPKGRGRNPRHAEHHEEIVTYTTAPSDYDWFGTDNLGVVGTLYGKPMRKVTSPANEVDRQRQRYLSSGTHGWFDEHAYEKLRTGGLIQERAGNPVTFNKQDELSDPKARARVMIATLSMRGAQDEATRRIRAAKTRYDRMYWAHVDDEIAKAHMETPFGARSEMTPFDGDRAENPVRALPEREWQILSDLEKPHGSRRVVSIGSLVIDRKLADLRDRGLIVWVQAHPHHTSLADDHYELTNEGRAALTAHRGWVKRIGTPTSDRKDNPVGQLTSAEMYTLTTANHQGHVERTGLHAATFDRLVKARWLTKEGQITAAGRKKMFGYAKLQSTLGGRGWVGDPRVRYEELGRITGAYFRDHAGKWNASQMQAYDQEKYGLRPEYMDAWHRGFSESMNAPAFAPVGAGASKKKSRDEVNGPLKPLARELTGKACYTKSCFTGPTMIPKPEVVAKIKGKGKRR